MKVYKEVVQKNDFDFWSGAVYTVDTLTEEQFETILNLLEESCDGSMSETELNDFFWFETDLIAEWLGFGSWEALEEINSRE